jgi:hypothetical protein
LGKKAKKAIVPAGYQEQKKSSLPNYVDKNGDETFLYICSHCHRAQTVDMRPRAGVKVKCKDKTEDGCGRKKFNLFSSRLYPAGARNHDARFPVIE